MGLARRVATEGAASRAESWVLDLALQVATEGPSSLAELDALVVPWRASLGLGLTDDTTSSEPDGAGTNASAGEWEVIMDPDPAPERGTVLAELAPAPERGAAVSPRAAAPATVGGRVTAPRQAKVRRGQPARGGSQVIPAIVQGSRSGQPSPRGRHWTATDGILEDVCEYCILIFPDETLPFRHCRFCRSRPSWHHGRCCPRAPRRPRYGAPSV